MLRKKTKACNTIIIIKMLLKSNEMKSRMLVEGWWKNGGDGSMTM